MTKTCPNCRHDCFHLAPICDECGWDFIETKLPRLNDDRLRSPYPFFGTKKKIASDLWHLFGDVKRYIEPFLDSAAMLLARPNAHPIRCIVSDANRYISNFWRAVQFQPAELAKWCDWPVNEADLHARHAWLEAQHFDGEIVATPSVNELMDRCHKLKEGLQQDPLWCDPKIAAWWAWGQSCWIGGGWCNGTQDWRKPECVADRGVHGKCRQVEVNGGGGVVSKPIPLIHPGGVLRGRPEIACLKGVHIKRSNTGRQPGVQRSHRQRLVTYFCRLQTELRDVIVCCGDWTRVVTPCLLGDRGTPCGVFLDPPYKRFGKCYGRYHDNLVSGRVRAWAIENGSNQLLRIVLCGYEGEHRMPPNWSVYRWDHAKGMSRSKKNLGNERVWCSPAIKPFDCLEALRRVK
jgi:DNA adenine methylase